jgi:hypothetical protein
MNPTYKKAIIAASIFFAIVLGFVLLFQKYKIENFPKSLTGASLTESEARTIAEKTCIKGGEALSAGS